MSWNWLASAKLLSQQIWLLSSKATHHDAVQSEGKANLQTDLLTCTLPHCSLSKTGKPRAAPAAQRRFHVKPRRSTKSVATRKLECEQSMQDSEN
jgi:hypothetical protein